MVGFSNWSDIFLMTGFSTMVERQVNAQINGADFVKTESYVGNYSMSNAIMNFNGTANPTYGSLHPVYWGMNPDEGLSKVQYEKGYQMLQWLSNSLGTTKFKQWLSYYISTNANTSVNSFQMQRSLNTWMQTAYSSAQTINANMGAFAINKWQYGIGSDPSGTLNFMTNNIQQSTNLAKSYISLAGNGSPTNYQQYNYYYSNLKVVFNNVLQATGINNGVTVAVLTKIDNDLKITNSKDPEVLQRWLATAICTGYTGNNVMTVAQNFVSSQGRMTFLFPIYTALMLSG